MGTVVNIRPAVRRHVGTRYGIVLTTRGGIRGTRAAAAARYARNMSVRVGHRDRDRFSRHSSRASADLAFPSSSSRDHSFRSVHSGRVPRVSSDDLMVPVRTLRSSSCRVTSGAPHRLRRHHSSAADCERARRSRRHTLELPNSRGPSVRSRSPEPPPLPPEPEIPPEDAGKEARRRRVVAAVAASFFALALASVLVVVVTLTHSSVLRAHNQTAKYYTFSVPPHHPLSEPRSCCPTVAPPASHATVSDPECQGLRTSPCPRPRRPVCSSPPTLAVHIVQYLYTHYDIINRGLKPQMPSDLLKGTK
ncbi:unnamed protein product [Parnassius apollo]|uniref:(apollo) hypothetical protein n=1 Tax=Parnassius apollo TaxID=110799 RepID=A0A8S3X189_PARAO|nr:unnamed protein product [Parnassius apollo]